LLERADEAAGRPAFGRVSISRVRRRIHRRWIALAAASVAAAAVILIAAGVFIVPGRPGQSVPEPQRIASLEEQVRQLQARTDATLRLVQEVLAKDRQERRLASLEAELATIPDPSLEIERQVDKTAFILFYQADRLYKELSQTESAVAAYKEIIQLFPKNRLAEVARERTSQIEKRQFNQSEDKGETRCKLPTA
jgi:TolA-binding protein